MGLTEIMHLDIGIIVAKGHETFSEEPLELIDEVVGLAMNRGQLGQDVVRRASRRNRSHRGNPVVTWSNGLRLPFHVCRLIFIDLGTSCRGE